MLGDFGLLVYTDEGLGLAEGILKESGYLSHY